MSDDATSMLPGDYVRILRAQVDNIAGRRWRGAVGQVRYVDAKNDFALVWTPVSDPFDVTCNISDLESIDQAEFESWQVPLKSDASLAPMRTKTRRKKKASK